MKKTKTVLCFVFLAAAAAAAIYAVKTYNYDPLFYPQKDSIVFLSVFAVCAVVMTAINNGLVSLILCTAAVVTASIFLLPCSYLIFPPLLIIWLYKNIGRTDTVGRICRAAAFALDGAAIIPFVIGFSKSLEFSAFSEEGRGSVFGCAVRGLLFLFAAFGAFVFFKSFSLVKTKKTGQSKKKKAAEVREYPERLHTVYLLAAVNTLASFIYSLATDDNALVCVCLIAWAGCYAALYISGEPVTAYLQTKAASFFGFPPERGRKER